MAAGVLTAGDRLPATLKERPRTGYGNLEPVRGHFVSGRKNSAGYHENDHAAAEKYRDRNRLL